MAPKKITRDWTQLLPELTGKVAETLTLISDHFRFRSVCTNWRSAAEFVTPPRQLPWLLVKERATHFRFLSPAEDWRSYTIPLRADPPLESSPMRTFGAAFGFVVIEYDTGALALVNPLVDGSWLPLPELPLDGIELGIELGIAAVEEVKVFKKEGVLSVLANMEFTTPYVWKFGEETWTKVSEEDWPVNSFMYHKGSYYVNVGQDRETEVIDAETLTTTMEIPSPEIEDEASGIFLTESSSGDLLMVSWDFKHGVNVFRLDDAGESKWVETTDIGDDILFLDIFNATCCPANESFGFKKNCVYYTYTHTTRNFDWCSVNLKDGSRKQEPHAGLDMFAVWAVLSLA